jgi:hypothetical protein
MKTKGYFFWKKHWVSLCSAHQNYDENCKSCQSGEWHNTWESEISNYFYNNCHGLWLWWQMNI